MEVEYYSGHRRNSYPVRIKKKGIWQEVKVIDSAVVEDKNGRRIRNFRCQVGDEIITIKNRE